MSEIVSNEEIPSTDLITSFDALSGPPPTSRELDQLQYHISLKEIGEKLQKAADIAFPNTTHFRYSAVYALLIYWEDEDPKLPVSIEAAELHDVLKNIYNYDVEIWEIPSEGSHKKLNQKILDFVELGGDSKDDLKIVYYGGHGMLACNRQAAWASRPDIKDPKFQSVKWGGIQHALEESESDVLLLLDSCASGTANTDVGHGVTELIAACGFNTSANPVGPDSFTRALITELVRLNNTPCFTVGALYNKILCRVQNWMPVGREMQKPPLHVVLTQNRRLPQSIQLSRKQLVCKSSSSDQVPLPVPLPVPSSGSHTLAVDGPRNKPQPSPKRRRESDPGPSERTQKRQQIQPHSRPQNNSPSPRDSPETNPFEQGSTVSSSSSPPSEKEFYPRISLTIRLKESLGLSEFNNDLFAEWIKMVPVLAHHVKVEAGFSSFSTLLILSLSVQLWCYLPHHPAISVIGMINSPNLLQGPAATSSVTCPESPGVVSNLHATKIGSSTTENVMRNDKTKALIGNGFCGVLEDQPVTDLPSRIDEAPPVPGLGHSEDLKVQPEERSAFLETSQEAFLEQKKGKDAIANVEFQVKDEVDTSQALAFRLVEWETWELIENDFNRVLAEFKRRLKPEQEINFASVTLSDLVLAVNGIQEKQERSKTVQNLTRIQPLLQAMVQYKDTLEELLNTSSLLCFVWGPMKLILLIASNWNKSFDVLLDSYQELGESIPLLQYRPCFGNNHHLKKILVWIYEDILKFHLLALRVFTQPAWKQVFNATWKDFQETSRPILSNILRYRELIEHQASVVQIQDALDTRLRSQASFAILEQNQNHTKKLAVLNWLSATDASLDQEAFSMTRQEVPNSSSWILQEPAIQSWLDPDDSIVPVFWLNGIPGAGKTVLTSVIIEEAMKLVTSKDISLAFFYCRHQDAQRNTFVSIVKAMLAQLLQQNPDILAYLHDCLSNASQLTLESQEECSKILGTVLLAVPKTFIIIDGIDECELKERRQILSYFTSAFRRYDGEPGKLRGFFVSQTENDIKKALHSAVTLRLTEEHNKRDIQSYANKHSLQIQQKFTSMPNEARDHIAQIVCETAQGMFLFAKLILENLYDQTNLTDLYQELRPDTFPRGLEQAYARVVKRIFENSNLTQRQTARQLLGWITYAARPLKWQEIQGIISVDVTQRMVNFEGRQLRDQIRDICGSLVDILPGNRIVLTHATAGMYLIHNNCIDERETETSLALLSMQYLTFDCFNNELSDDDMHKFLLGGYYAFLDYASLHWDHHLERAVRFLRPQDLHDSTDLPIAINEFFEMYDPGPMEVDKTYKEYLQLCDGIEKADCYEALLLLLSHEKASRLAKEKLEALGPLGVTVRRVRAMLEGLSLSSTLDHHTMENLKNFYGENWYKCSRHACFYFHEGFANERALIQHTTRHERPFCCTEMGCTRMYIGWSTEKELKKHMKQYHPDPEAFSWKFPHVKKPRAIFQCNLCSKQFTRASSLNTHRLREHAKERPFTCKTCGKGFVRKYERDRHESIHT